MKFRLVESFLDVDIDKDGLIKDTVGNVIGSTKSRFGNFSGSTAKGENVRQGEKRNEQGEGQGSECKQDEQGEGQDSKSEKESENAKDSGNEKESESEKESENEKESEDQGQLKPSQGRKGKGKGQQIKNDGKLYHDPRYAGTWKFKVSDEDSEKYKLKPEDQFYDAKVDDSKYGDIYDRY